MLSHNTRISQRFYVINHSGWVIVLNLRVIIIIIINILLIIIIIVVININNYYKH